MIYLELYSECFSCDFSKRSFFITRLFAQVTDLTDQNTTHIMSEQSSIVTFFSLFLLPIKASYLPTHLLHKSLFYSHFYWYFTCSLSTNHSFNSFFKKSPFLVLPSGLIESTHGNTCDFNHTKIFFLFFHFAAMIFHIVIVKSLLVAFRNLMHFDFVCFFTEQSNNL